MILPVPQQKILDTQLWCPMSGFKAKDGTIEPHKVTMMQAADGSLFARCERHVAKIFVQDSMTINRVMESSTVVRIKEKRARKELPNGAS